MLTDEMKDENDPTAVAEPQENTKKAIIDSATSILPANNTTEPIQPTNYNKECQSVANFGWEQIENGPLIPFIRRGSTRYVASYIVGEKVTRNTWSVFSHEMNTCVQVELFPMSSCEAMTYNEINITHCDKGLVGDYIFKQGDSLVSLKSVKKFVEFFHACRNSIICGQYRTNKLFGFIRINGENEVPFVWNGNQKLVPLFYFEGQNEYVDAKSKVLLDRWHTCYLTFCFKAQKIRKQFFSQGPLKVVDFKDVETLFPYGSIFELCWPKNINQDLLAPEIRSSQVPRKRPAEPSTEISPKQTRIDNTNVSSIPMSFQNQPQVMNQNLLTQPNVTETPSRHAKPPQMIGQPVVSQQLQYAFPDITITPVDYRASSSQPVNPGYLNSCSDLASITPIYSPKGPPNVTMRCYEQAATKKLQQLARDNHVFVEPQRTANMQKDLGGTTGIIDWQTRREQITNVPSGSPQIASSPGIRQPSPLMTEARQRVPMCLPNPNLVDDTEVPNFVQHNSSVHHPSPNKAAEESEVQRIYNFLEKQQAEPIKETPRKVLETRMHQLAARELILSQNVRQNLEKLNMLQQEKNELLQQQVGTNSVPVYYPPTNNTHEIYGNDSFVASTGHQAIPTAFPLNYGQNFDALNGPLVQNVNVAITNVIADKNGAESYILDSTVSTKCNKNLSDTDINTWKLKFTITDLNCSHLDPYETKDLPFADKTLLGIRMSRDSTDYLVNFAQFGNQVLADRHFNNLWKLLKKFKTIYRLNRSQQVQWDEIVKKRNLVVSDLRSLKDVFVNYSEITTVLKQLAWKTLEKVPP